MKTKLPECIGFIMDGNRRFAKAQGISTLKGHQQGWEVLQAVIAFLRDKEISHGVFYAFSTENWQRSEKEVTYLLKLFKVALNKVYKDLLDTESPVKVRFIGQREKFSFELQSEMKRLEDLNFEHKEAKTTIWIALSYGGRAEIVSAVNEALAVGQEVTEESFAKLLWTADMPDPDIIVRTGGDRRLSNFLTWSSAYSELYFIEKHWPALTEEDFEDILHEYAKRERRRGK